MYSHIIAAMLFVSLAPSHTVRQLRETITQTAVDTWRTRHGSEPLAGFRTTGKRVQKSYTSLVTYSTGERLTLVARRDDTGYWRIVSKQWRGKK